MAGTIPRDPYEVLGVPRDADETAIKKSFRRLARELHPDVNAHDPEAEEKFKEAAEAYEILSNAERRAIYDRHGHEGLRTGGMGPNFEGFGSITDLFEAFFGAGTAGGFGGRAGGPTQGDDAILGIDIDLAQAADGVRMPVTFEAVDRCGTCDGEGAQPGTPVRTCERCGGSGVLQAVARSPFGQVMRSTACDACRGEGRIPEQPCATCDGRGRVVGPHSLDVDVPPGISDGQRIRLAGSGHAGEHGGPPGDLYVQVHVRADERLIRDGDDLVTVLDVPAPLAALGADLDAPSLDGETQVHVPTGTQPGEVLTVKGGGMPHLRHPARRGDLRVVVNVMIPRRLTAEQRELLSGLAESLTPENLAAPETVGAKLRRLLGGRR
jgi:molecular chaperone DnaJ